jgi:hypothetical protein
MMRGTSTVYYICTVLVGLWALRGDVFANNCPQEQTAARLHILRFEEEEQLKRWKTDNDSLGSLGWRIYTDDLAELRRRLNLAPDAPVPEIEITRYTADLANMLATQYQNTLQELRSKAKNNKPDLPRRSHPPSRNYAKIPVSQKCSCGSIAT